MRAEKLLRWNFEPRQTLRVTITQKSEQETTLNNKPVKTTVEMLMEMDWSVDSLDQDGAAQMTQSFTRLKLKVDGANMGAVEFDSAAEAPPEGAAKSIADGVRPLLGAKFHLKMNGRGEITDAGLPEETIESLRTAPGSKRLKDFFTAQSLSEMLQQSSAVLPEKPIETGATWVVTTQTKSPLGSLEQRHGYTYDGTEKRDGRTLEKISVQSTLELQRPKETDENASDQRREKLKITEQQQSGVLYFDAEAGRFTESQVTQKLTSETPYRNSIIQVKVNSTMHMTIAPAEKANGN